MYQILSNSLSQKIVVSQNNTGFAHCALVPLLRRSSSLHDLARSRLEPSDGEGVRWQDEEARTLAGLQARTASTKSLHMLGAGMGPWGQVPPGAVPMWPPGAMQPFHPLLGGWPGGLGMVPGAQAAMGSMHELNKNFLR